MRVLLPVIYISLTALGCSKPEGGEDAAHVVTPAAVAVAETDTAHAAPPVPEVETGVGVPPTEAAKAETGTPGEAPAPPQVAPKPASPPAKPKLATPQPSPQPTGAKTEKAEPAAPKPAAPKPAAKTTRVPSTKHVRVEHGAGLQKLLDADPRMQGWINRVMQVIGRCYDSERAKNASAGGAIRVRLTMHENERPSPDIESLPPALAGLVPCATGDLMRVRMPLFTGPEGEKHLLKILFKP